jgi:hypothetical protein
VRLTYPITGAVCTIDCPLPRITFREGVQTHG